MSVSAKKKFELISEILNDDDLPGIIKELTYYSSYRFRMWKLLDERGVVGFSPEEIAIEAIKKVMTGEWNWDPDKKELIPYLKSFVIKGLVANLATKKEVQLSVNDEDAIDNAGSRFPSLDEDLNSKQILEVIQNHIEGDEHVEYVFLGLYEDFKRSDTCKEFNLTPQEYDNANKRLKRKLKELEDEGAFKSIKEQL